MLPQEGQTLDGDRLNYYCGVFFGVLSFFFFFFFFSLAPTPALPRSEYYRVLILSFQELFPLVRVRAWGIPRLRTRRFPANVSLTTTKSPPWSLRAKPMEASPSTKRW
jgi:hypothetical protein